MADQCKLSAAMVAGSEERSYVLKVHGYSTAKRVLKSREFMASPTFSVGSHSFLVRYCPHDVFEGYADVVSFFLVLDSANSKDVKVKARLDVHVVKDTRSGETVGNRFVVVPPSDLHLHLGNLLESMVGADVTFDIGGEKFLAHRSVLAARSPVFKVELHGAMKETAGSPIVIHEMEADVFRCLLRFIYTDSLPALDVVMAGHLLVAADRFGLERLKLICEHKLCSHIDASMVATSLALADQHGCNGLKEACFQFLATPSNLEAMMASDGYEHLKISCPSALKELIARLLPVTMKAAKDIVMSV